MPLTKASSTDSKRGAVVEQADTRDLKSLGPKDHSGSTPDSATIHTRKSLDAPPPPRKSLATSSLPRGIRLRGPIYQVFVTVRGSRRSGTASTLEAAIELRDTLKGQLEVGTITGKVWTLQIAIEKTFESVWANARSAAQLRSNAEESALCFGATTKITDITTDRVDEYIAKLKHKRCGRWDNQPEAGCTQ